MFVEKRLILSSSGCGSFCSSGCHWEICQVQIVPSPPGAIDGGKSTMTRSIPVHRTGAKSFASAETCGLGRMAVRGSQSVRRSALPTGLWRRQSEFQATLRRRTPEKRTTQLKARDEADLAFIETTSIRPRKLLYDTTVYIDILQDRFSQNGEPMLRAAEAWRSPVTEAELAAGIGLLDPARPHTREITGRISTVIERRPSYRTIAPDPEIWREAGILSGVLARLQGYGPDGRRRALNDALLFATARKHGCTVLTRNIVDFDLLAQLDPAGSVLFDRSKGSRPSHFADRPQKS